MTTIRLYEDVPAAILERDEGLVRCGEALPGAAWQGFLQRMLPPVAAGAPDTARALRSPQGMADFLLSQGSGAARDLSGALAGQDGFWRDVCREVEQLAPN